MMPTWQLLVERMRSYGPYIALHLRYEKDMLAFSGCTYGLSPAEADELTKIRYNMFQGWIYKQSNGFIPLNLLSFFLSEKTLHTGR